MSINYNDFLNNTSWVKSLKLPCSLPIKDGWNIPDYPVIASDMAEQTFFYYKRNYCFAEVRITVQDEIPVGGINHMVGGGGSCGDGGGGFAPGRKWGEFETFEAADLYYSRELLECLISKGEYSEKHKRLTDPCIKKLIEHINSINVLNIQLELFA